MPVGTSFENSAMKTCFSLSSLPAPEAATPDKSGNGGGVVVKQRLYSSLTKNRVKATAIRRSWGSTASEHRDDFWKALQANYNYIMDNQLIDKCQEANSDLSINVDCEKWSLKEFNAQFSELYSWLNSVQEIIYGSEENIGDKTLRAHCTNMVHEKSSLLALFNEQASQLAHLNADVQEKVVWRVKQLNSKWDCILSILGPSECGHCEQDNCLDIDHEIKCLRKWFKNMESCLEPLNFRTKYTKTELQAKALELEVLHKDIENHGKIVGSVVKLCKRPDASCNTVNVRRIANGLERRWHLLYLRSLEWQCHLETLSKKENYGNTCSSSDETDSDYYEEPANKYPRLSSNRDSCGSLVENQPLKNETNDASMNFDEDVMNKNAKKHPINNINKISPDIVDGQLRFQQREDTSQFTRSNRKGPNLATYYFKHEDTDSDMDKIEQNAFLLKNDNDVQSANSALDETSEEEWTYTKNHNNDMAQDNDSKDESPKQLSEDTIRELVMKAEELVSPDKRKNRVHLKVKRWLSMDKPDDSCDASGEDDERESQLSEDYEENTITQYNSQNFSLNDLHNSVVDVTAATALSSTPKVNFRQRKFNANRPWSVSCISQLGQSSPTKIIDNNLNFSTSESALHQISLTSKQLERNHSSNAVSTNSIGLNGNNSTSSTVEESCCQLIQEKTSPNRRRKLKSKKKMSFTKIDHAIVTNSTITPSLKQQRTFLIKSGSFSGCGNAINFNNERQTSSDPSAMHFGKYETSTTSGNDSEEDSKRMPYLKIGFKPHYLNNNLRDTSPGKSSLNTTEEQSSLLSEQAAWDPYQEKYNSEAYSESHDSDAARKLLEFGEDYRSFLDSQSDWSTNTDISPKLRRRYIAQSESESDTESLRQLFKKSKDQLDIVRNYYSELKNNGNAVEKSHEVDEMIDICNHHIDCLDKVKKSSDELQMSRADREILAELIMEWTSLKRNIYKIQESRTLSMQVTELKNLLTSFDITENDCMGSVDDLSKEIDLFEKKSQEFSLYKERLLALNMAYHRFINENKDYERYSSIDKDIPELYRLWDNLSARITSRLSQLKPLLQQLKTVDNRLEQLHVDLRSDQKTLHLLDNALQGGTLFDQTATYVRDVAKLLSENTSVQGCKIPELFTEGGSLSDSGISDEGSEHEIGERVRRLAAIRRLVRQLEAVLAPDCQARLKMAERLNAAEEELKKLQKHCKSLIADTAAFSSPLPPSSTTASVATTPCLNGAVQLDESVQAVYDPDDDDDPGDSKSSSWFNRVMRASLPFQVVIITLLCVACLLEPQCCDNMNNFAMSLSPQLRYIKGPPPI